MLGDIGVGQNLSHVAGHQAQKLVFGGGQASGSSFKQAHPAENQSSGGR